MTTTTITSATVLAGCDPVRLTDSMQRGLRVVARHDGRSRRSNITDVGGNVYWQTISYLCRAGLIERTTGAAEYYRLTPLGQRVVYALDERAPS